MCLGIPGRIVEITEDAAMPMGIVDFGGVKRETCLAYVADEVTVGDYVIVHVGFAITKLDEEEAERTFELLREIGEQGDEQWLEDIADRSIDAQNKGLA